MPLYEVAIIEKPTKKQAEEDGVQDKLVFGPKAVIARDPQGAAVAAVLDGSFPKEADRTRMEVLVRPFA